VLEEIQSSRPVGEEEGRGYLGRFLFSGDDVFKLVSVLSGGERSRVALAKLILESPNVLILDEPTNHLDIASREALLSVLQEFGGTILFVSHDRYLIDSLAQQLWVIGNGALLRFGGTYSEYVAGKAAPLDRADARPSKSNGSTPGTKLDELAVEATALANRLAEVSATAPLGQLAELIDRYADLQTALAGSQSDWVGSIRQSLRESSD